MGKGNDDDGGRCKSYEDGRKGCVSYRGVFWGGGIGFDWGSFLFVVEYSIFKTILLYIPYLHILVMFFPLITWESPHSSPSLPSSSPLPSGNDS